MQRETIPVSPVPLPPAPDTSFFASPSTGAAIPSLPPAVPGRCRNPGRHRSYRWRKRLSIDSEIETQHRNALGVAPVCAYTKTERQALIFHKVSQAQGHGPNAGDGGGNGPAWNAGHG